ncbi:MAG: hypothetical protein D6770_02585 [Anaerolineae bacterium]|nr:MAG: hypothetical protein D6770_02585 [Anaerolineae bacterium]
MSNGKRYSLLKPTLETPFHIDFNWWRQNDRDWRVYLRSLLCEEHKNVFTDWESEQTIDWVDPVTAEVTPVDGLQHTLMTHCAKQPGFLTEHTALVEAVFRLFLANGNTPMTAKELAMHLRRPAATILRTLAGPRVYRGLRPCCD